KEVIGASTPAARGLLDSSQVAWRNYVHAETAAILASLSNADPTAKKRVEANAAVRLSADRRAHLILLDDLRKGQEARCEQLDGEERMLARVEAGCAVENIDACTTLAQALQWGWYSIDRDWPRALRLYAHACERSNGTACESISSAVASGRGIARDPASAAKH